MTYRQFIKTAAGFLVAGFCWAASAAADPIGVAQANATMNQGTAAASPAVIASSPLTVFGLLFAPSGRGAVASGAQCFTCMMGTMVGSASTNNWFGALVSDGGLAPIFVAPTPALTGGGGGPNPVVVLLPPALFMTPTPFLILLGNNMSLLQAFVDPGALLVGPPVQISATPEPAELALFAGGLGLAAFALKRRTT